MARIVFIGAGSLGFTRGLVRDLLTFPLLEGSTIVLMDINRERLEFSRKACQIFVDRSGKRFTVEATLNRAAALKGADAVLSTIRAGGVNVWRHDLEIPAKFGVSMNIGDTRSVGGVFRAIREIPVMLGLVRDMERYCPEAIFLNYTNPMAMLCRAIQRTSPIRATGLCHSVQGTAEMLARWIGADMKDVTYTCAGINHQAFYLDYRVQGKDAYPRIRKAVTTSKKVYMEEIVRNEMFLALDYYVTESSGHASEYNAWFRKRPELIRKYCERGTGWNPGKPLLALTGYLAREKAWRRDMRRWFKDGAPFQMERGHEYAANIINARMGGEPFRFNGNVPNVGLVPNLPARACVEVPVYADRHGFNPIPVEPLPPQLAALINTSVAVEEMAVEACLAGDPRLVYQALCFDPLCAAVLDLREIKRMAQELLTRNKPWLPTFKKGVRI